MLLEFLYRTTQRRELPAAVCSATSQCRTRLHAQAGVFLPTLLEQTGLLNEAKTDEAIMELNVILVYKKLVQGLIYSPPDCDRFLALDASLQV